MLKCHDDAVELSQPKRGWQIASLYREKVHHYTVSTRTQHRLDDFTTLPPPLLFLREIGSQGVDG